MDVVNVNISMLKTNPNNPRVIRDDKFDKLVKSLKEFPDMLNARPVVCNKDMIVLGGNMRLKAAKAAGMKTLPVMIAETWTEDQERQFIIKDNVSGGEWDWDMIANEWDAQEIEDWGLFIPNWAEGHDVNDMDDDDVDLTEEFDPIGTMDGKQRVVFLFDGPEEAESYLNSLHVEFKKRNMAWQVNLTTPSI